MIRDLTALCQSGIFHLTKWISNNGAILASIPETWREKEREQNLIYDALPDDRWQFPVNLPAKVILQELCGNKFSWNENVLAEMACKSVARFSDFMKFHGFTVDKPVGFEPITFAQLHHFA